MHSLLSQTIQELSDWFGYQRDMGVYGYDISESTSKILQRWGLGNDPLTAETCLGRADSSVFLVDSTAGFFDGEPGALLVKILKAMNLAKDDVFICSGKDLPGLKRSVRTGRPNVIITLGEESFYRLFGNGASFASGRGKLHRLTGVNVMPTWHPGDLLSDSSRKRELWEDMKQVMALTGL
ncbi:MAG: hypothetical protein R6V41_11175 [Desulfobacteraceae bacterium]